MVRSLRSFPLAGISLAALAACGPPEPLADTNLIRRSATFVGAAAPPPEGAPFVRESRPGSGPRYIPVGVTPPAREREALPADAVKAAETDLAATREKSSTFARRPPPPSTYGVPTPPVVPPQEP